MPRWIEVLYIRMYSSGGCIARICFKRHCCTCTNCLFSVGIHFFSLPRCETNILHKRRTRRWCTVWSIDLIWLLPHTLMEIHSFCSICLHPRLFRFVFSPFPHYSLCLFLSFAFVCEGVCVCVLRMRCPMNFHLKQCEWCEFCPYSFQSLRKHFPNGFTHAQWKIAQLQLLLLIVVHIHYSMPNIDLISEYIWHDCQCEWLWFSSLIIKSIWPIRYKRNLTRTDMGRNLR